MLTMAPRQAAMTAGQFKAMLAERGLSYAAAAKKIGVNRRTVIRWAMGDSGISPGQKLLIKSKLK